MSTAIRPDQTPSNREPGAQALMMWLGIAMLVVTAVIVVAITTLGVTAGVAVAFGVLIVAALGVLVYIVRFIGPED
jgi:hypothetical protein